MYVLKFVVSKDVAGQELNAAFVICAWMNAVGDALPFLYYSYISSLVDCTAFDPELSSEL